MKTLFFVLLACSFCSFTWGETITLKLGEQGKEMRSEGTLPARGSTMTEVRAEHGDPTETTGPTGNPQITTWHFEHFSVYFEGQHVIHSVIKHSPKHIPSPKAAD